MGGHFKKWQTISPITFIPKSNSIQKIVQYNCIISSFHVGNYLKIVKEFSLTSY